MSSRTWSKSSPLRLSDKDNQLLRQPFGSCWLLNNFCILFIFFQEFLGQPFGFFWSLLMALNFIIKHIKVQNLYKAVQFGELQSLSISVCSDHVPTISPSLLMKVMHLKTHIIHRPPPEQWEFLLDYVEAIVDLAREQDEQYHHHPLGHHYHHHHAVLSIFSILLF